VSSSVGVDPIRSDLGGRGGGFMFWTGFASDTGICRIVNLNFRLSEMNLPNYLSCHDGVSRFLSTVKMIFHCNKTNKSVDRNCLQWSLILT
jgi:hypothetical protein